MDQECKVEDLVEEARTTESLVEEARTTEDLVEEARTTDRAVAHMADSHQDKKERDCTGRT